MTDNPMPGETLNDIEMLLLEFNLFCNLPVQFVGDPHTDDADPALVYYKDYKSHCFTCRSLSSPYCEINGKIALLTCYETVYYDRVPILGLWAEGHRETKDVRSPEYSLWHSAKYAEQIQHILSKHNIVREKYVVCKDYGYKKTYRTLFSYLRSTDGKSTMVSFNHYDCFNLATSEVANLVDTISAALVPRLFTITRDIYNIYANSEALILIVKEMRRGDSKYDPDACSGFYDTDFVITSESIAPRYGKYTIYFKTFKKKPLQSTDERIAFAFAVAERIVKEDYGISIEEMISTGTIRINASDDKTDEIVDIPNCPIHISFQRPPKVESNDKQVELEDW